MTIVRKDDMDRKIEIDLTGPDGNAFVLLGNAKKLAKMLHYNETETEELLNDMRSGDYEHLVEVFDKHFGEIVDLLR